MTKKMIQNGIVIGKFAPLTRGHINLINYAATMCERLIVVVSHDDRWLARQSERDQRLLTLKNRIKWVSQIYKDIDHVSVEFIIENDIPEFPNGWKEYSDLINDNYGHLKDITIFSSEIDYDNKFKEYLPWFDHVVVDAERSRVPISATKIREHLYDNWDYLPSVVRRDFVRKIVILGTESSGKTVLTKYLSKLYNTAWVEEAGRTYCLEDMAGNELLLSSDDYDKIAFRHKELEFEAEKTANRIMFVDTNAFITEFYHRLYEKKENTVVSAIAKKECYDLVIVLAPTVKWVDDGLRVNSDRSITSKLFQEMKEEFPNQFPVGKTIYIDSSDYTERMEQAINAVDKLIEEWK